MIYPAVSLVLLYHLTNPTNWRMIVFIKQKGQRMKNYEKIAQCESAWEMAKYINKMAADMIISAVLNDEIIDADSWDELLQQEAE